MLTERLPQGTGVRATSGTPSDRLGTTILAVHLEAQPEPVGTIPRTHGQAGYASLYGRRQHHPGDVADHGGALHQGGYGQYPSPTTRTRTMFAPCLLVCRGTAWLSLVQRGLRLRGLRDCWARRNQPATGLA